MDIHATLGQRTGPSSLGWFLRVQQSEIDLLTSDAEGIAKGLCCRLVLIRVLLHSLLEVQILYGPSGLAVVGVHLVRIPVEERDRRHDVPLRLEEVG